MKCPKCEYEWLPRVEQPKECPNCKGRLTKPKGKKNENNS